MHHNVSGCYYHPNRLSVAVCSECGHGLCRDCIIKGRSGKTLCIDCANSELKQEHKEYRKILRERGGRFRTGKDFVVPGMIGIVLCIALTLLAIADRQAFTLPNDPLQTAVVIVFLEYHIFAVPFCIRGLMDIFAPRYTAHLSMLKIIIYVIVPAIASWLFLSFYLVRFFTGPKRNQ